MTIFLQDSFFGQYSQTEFLVYLGSIPPKDKFGAFMLPKTPNFFLLTRTTTSVELCPFTNYETCSTFISHSLAPLKSAAQLTGPLFGKSEGPWSRKSTFLLNSTNKSEPGQPNMAAQRHYLEPLSVTASWYSRDQPRPHTSSLLFNLAQHHL